jgi:hypothetical protein
MAEKSMVIHLWHKNKNPYIQRIHVCQSLWNLGCKKFKFSDAFHFDAFNVVSTFHFWPFQQTWNSLTLSIMYFYLYWLFQQTWNSLTLSIMYFYLYWLNYLVKVWFLVMSGKYLLCLDKSTSCLLFIYFLNKRHDLL